jgi:hypothetical protein
MRGLPGIAARSGLNMAESAAVGAMEGAGYGPEGMESGVVGGLVGGAVGAPIAGTVGGLAGRANRYAGTRANRLLTLDEHWNDAQRMMQPVDQAGYVYTTNAVNAGIQEAEHLAYLAGYGQTAAERNANNAQAIRYINAMRARYSHRDLSPSDFSRMIADSNEFYDPADQASNRLVQQIREHLENTFQNPRPVDIYLPPGVTPDIVNQTAQARRDALDRFRTFYRREGLTTDILRENLRRRPNEQAITQRTVARNMRTNRQTGELYMRGYNARETAAFSQAADGTNFQRNVLRPLSSLGSGGSSATAIAAGTIGTLFGAPQVFYTAAVPAVGWMARMTDRGISRRTLEDIDYLLEKGFAPQEAWQRALAGRPPSVRRDLERLAEAFTRQLRDNPQATRRMFAAPMAQESLE